MPEVTGREPIKLLLTSSAKSREIWSIVPPDKKVKKKRTVPVLTERPNKKFAQLSVADDAFLLREYCHHSSTQLHGISPRRKKEK